jgi:hypothetical protein
MVNLIYNMVLKERALRRLDEEPWDHVHFHVMMKMEDTLITEGRGRERIPGSSKMILKERALRPVLAEL